MNRAARSELFCPQTRIYIFLKMKTEEKKKTILVVLISCISISSLAILTVYGVLKSEGQEFFQIN